MEFGQTSLSGVRHGFMPPQLKTKTNKTKNLAQNFFDFHAWVKKCHFGNFSERLIWHFLTHA
jgi:hypothetical protein